MSRWAAVHTGLHAIHNIIQTMYIKPQWQRRSLEYHTFYQHEVQSEFYYHTFLCWSKWFVYLFYSFTFTSLPSDIPSSRLTSRKFQLLIINIHFSVSKTKILSSIYLTHSQNHSTTSFLFLQSASSLDSQFARITSLFCSNTFCLLCFFFSFDLGLCFGCNLSFIQFHSTTFQLLVQPVALVSLGIFSFAFCIL